MTGKLIAAALALVAAVGLSLAGFAAAHAQTPDACGCVDCRCPDCNGEVCSCEACGCGECGCAR